MGKNNIDWDQRRYEIAKEMLSHIYNKVVPLTEGWKEEHVKEALQYADLFITKARQKAPSLKVFINRRRKPLSGGILLVAAHDKEEAHEVAKGDNDLELFYWEEYRGKRFNEASCDYQQKDWQELKGVIYNGTPRVLAEDGYSE